MGPTLFSPHSYLSFCQLNTLEHSGLGGLGQTHFGESVQQWFHSVGKIAYVQNVLPGLSASTYTVYLQIILWLY